MRALMTAGLLLGVLGCAAEEPEETDWFDDQHGLLDPGEDDDEDPPDDEEDPEDDDPPDDDPPDDDPPDDDPEDEPAAGLLVDGEYWGELELLWVDEGMGDERLCTGTLEVIVMNESTWPVHGEAMCTFDWGGFLEQELVWVSFKGRDTDEGDLWGEARFTLGEVGFEVPFTGSAGETHLRFELDGEGVYATDMVDTDVSWTGGATAER